MMKKILLLGNANSIHIRRWVEGISARGFKVYLVTCHEFDYEYPDGISVYKLKYKAPYGYLLNVLSLKILIKKLAPDVFHVHYASGYGTLAALTFERNRVVSVWGADVYDFPSKSILHRYLIKFNLETAKAVTSTSHAMLRVVNEISPKLKKTRVVSFGVDIDNFYPRNKKDNSCITIGTVKSLHRKYGIDTLIKAFSLLKQQYPLGMLKLVIVGDGPDRKGLDSLVEQLNLFDSVIFKGYIDNRKIPDVLGSFHIYSALSRLDSESFGVAAVEANACGLPVVVSDVSGFKEVVLNGVTGFIVERDSPEAAADAIKTLIDDPALRSRIGHQGLKHVNEKYTWDVSLKEMTALYSELTGE